MSKVAAFFIVGALAATIHAAEFNVTTNGSDSNAGTPAAPFRTIQHAADLAQPGDIITVHQGVYRERIDPPRGGTSDAKRITYQAAHGEKVVITGSEPMKGWVKVTNDTWKVTIPNSFFGAFNPYRDIVHGDWCRNPHPYHTGAVYLNGDWLIEAATLDEALKPSGANQFWFGTVDETNTTIWAQFSGVNPNGQNVEINVEPSNLQVFDNSALPCFASGNVFSKRIQPSKFDANALVEPDFNSGLKLAEKTGGWYLTLRENKAWRGEKKRQLVTTAWLGKAKVPNCAYENADGSPVKIDVDYFGQLRDKKNPFPGPFECVKNGIQRIKVWPAMTNRAVEVIAAARSLIRAAQTKE